MPYVTRSVTRARIAELRALVARLRAENEQIRAENERLRLEREGLYEDPAAACRAHIGLKLSRVQVGASAAAAA